MLAATTRGFQAAQRLGVQPQRQLLARGFSHHLGRQLTNLWMAKSGAGSTKKRNASTKARKGEFWEARMEDCWRPTVNDVERISWGKPAKKKGTGSRGTPHRLNQDERFLFDQARRKGFLEVAGSGWRSQRREAPLLNSYRSYCDAKGQACIVLHKRGNNGMNEDELVVDLSPLRTPESFPDVASICLQLSEMPGQIVSIDENDDANDDEEEVEDDKSEIVNDEDSSSSPWITRPIYHLPAYYIAWEIPRSEAKKLGKKMATLFDSKDENAKAPSKKPIGVKHGKGRRHGGYGIG